MAAVTPVARPVEGLKLAVANFSAALTDDQRRKFYETRAVPDADSILVFTAELDSANRSRKGRSVCSRVSKLLQSVRDFCSIIGIFVSSHPEIAALVWGSIVVNYTSYYEAISELLMNLGRLCPLFTEYGSLYRSSQQLQESLSNFHASIIRCWHRQIREAFSRSFDQEFRPDTNEIRKCSDNVKDAIRFAKAHIDAQEQKLQAEERTEAAKGRAWLKTITSRTQSDNNSIRLLLLRKAERDAQERKQKLLDAVCTYNPERLLKQNQRKRFGNTAAWMIQTVEFCEWNDFEGSSLLWCSGKIGSGKSVITASVIDHLFIQKGRSDILVSYYFAHHSDQESLKAETIMRSLIRQRLPTSTQLSDQMEEKLRGLKYDSELNEIAEFLCGITPASKPSYIIVDGLDECDHLDRSKLLKALSSLVASTTNTKLFLASRASLSGELQKYFGSMIQVSMDNSEVSDDIKTYIDGTLRERREREDLKVRDPQLVEEIAQALAHGADGMFLWVDFQVTEVCEQLCDEDIRQSLKNLPKTLEELFCRILYRILRRGHEKITAKTFLWIAASTRPLALEELREAIAIEIGQQYAKPERLHNDINSIVSVCENLVHVDEEYRSIQFAHHTVKQFLVQQPALFREPIDSDLSMFFIDLEEADHFIGEICVTYLDFNDFKTTLSRRAKPTQLPKPDDIITEKRGSNGASAPVLYLDRTNDSIMTSRAVIDAHPFLRYASTTWIQHTKEFQNDRSKMWSVWKNLIVVGHDLALKPWQPELLNVDSHALLEWAQKAHHYALMRLIVSSRILSDREQREVIFNAIDSHDVAQLDIFLMNDMRAKLADHALQKAAGAGHLDIVERLLAAKANRLLAAKANVNAAAAKSHGRTALQAAAGAGHLDIVERLLVAKANVNAAAAKSHGRTALQAAAGAGHLDIVERLLAAKADVNAAAAEYDGRTALQTAAEAGHLDIIERLLAAKADVNAAAGYSGRTALQAAAGAGHLDIVERLLAAKADVNAAATAESHGRTALQAAAGAGHRDIVERLLAAKANVNAAATYNNGRTALQAAAEAGHLDIVERLLAAKANVNAAAAKSHGRTALQAAAGAGHLDIIERLLAAKADVNAAARYGGRTALQAAAGAGYLDIVERLLAAKANVNAAAAYNDGHTALQAAAGAGHLDIVERLLAAKADVNAAAAEYDGRTALQAAAGAGHLDIVEKLRRAGAKA
ncbi:ankyrin repeat-containing domain protein [Hypoxylon sp. FL1284]|nr:ankyrin repeat-containing domain protein [Hypoxylon sp. FL1284]